MRYPATTGALIPRKPRSSPDTPTMHYDSTGNRLEIGVGEEFPEAESPRPLAAVIARMVDTATHDLEDRLDAAELDDLGSKWCGDFSAIMASPWSKPVEAKPAPDLPKRVARAVSRTLIGRRITTAQRNAILAAVLTVLDERTLLNDDAPEGKEHVAKVGDS